MSIKLLKLIFQKKRTKLHLADDLMGLTYIPNYARQEFHNLPGGNYSNTLATGYIRGFDIAMLGEMKHSRAFASEKLKMCSSVLDIGCGGGSMTNKLLENNIYDVWGIDISPYLLKQAALRNPKAKFLQAKAEDLPFSTERFDGISICYVLHEIPPKYIDLILDEIYRVLKPSGLCIFIEPSSIHYYGTYWSLLKIYGFKGAYFRFLSHFVYEPFAKSWHELNFEQLLFEKSFSLIKHIKNVPNNIWVVKKN
jgi:ubiquinone/menaquinone biosynthesis C-methylase UbiE